VGISTNGVIRSELLKFVITCATVTLGQYITKRYFHWRNSPHPARYAYSGLCKILTFRGPCIIIYSYNKNQRDAQFLRFILDKNSTCRVIYQNKFEKLCISLAFIIRLCNIVDKLTRPKSNTHINKFTIWDYGLHKFKNSYTFRHRCATPTKPQIQTRTSPIVTSILEL